MGTLKIDLKPSKFIWDIENSIENFNIHRGHRKSIGYLEDWFGTLNIYQGHSECIGTLTNHWGYWRLILDTEKSLHLSAERTIGDIEN